MPALVVWAVAAIGTAIGGAAGAMLIMYAAEVAFGAMLLGSAALSMSQQRKAQKKQREAYNASQVDRMQNVVTTIGQRELVLGRVRKAGTVFGRASTGDSKEKFVMAIALAGHEIDGVETIYFNDTPVALDVDGKVTTEPYAISRRGPEQAFFLGDSVTLTGAIEPDSVSVTRHVDGPDGGYDLVVPHTLLGNDVTIGDMDGGIVHYQVTTTESKAQVRIYLGTDSQTADPGLVALFPGSWTSDHRARGVAYLVCEFDYDETAFTSGIPAVSAIIRGAKVFDPRDDSTAWSENPALLARHVLTHPAFGKRTSITAAEDARISAAANACDTENDYEVDGVTATRPLFTAGYVVPYGSPAKEVLDDLTQAMGGMWAYAGGEFFIRAGVYSASVMSLTEADLGVVKRSEDGSTNQQPIVIGTHKARADKVNVITPRIWDEEQGYKQVALTPLAPAALIERDGAWLAHEIDLPAVTYSPQALHIAGIIIRDDRDSLNVTLPFKLKAYPVELFDTIDLTIARYGWTSKEFIVLRRAWSLEGLLQLTLKETAAEIFQPDAEFDPQGYAANTDLPRPWDILPPENIVITSGTDELIRQADGTITVRVRVVWDAVTDASLLTGGFVDVRYRLASQTDWYTITVPANESSLYIFGAKDGDVGLLQARTRNVIASSDWSVQQYHEVVGKTEAPGDVTSFAATGIVGGIRVTGVLPTDPDLAYIELWMGTTSTLGAATLIEVGLTNSYDKMGLSAADGARYFWARAVDTSGNAGNYVGPVSATAGVTMGAITGLAATGIAEGIRITGTLPSNADLAYVILYMHTTSTFGSASEIARGVSSSFDKTGLTVADGPRYFWTKCVSTSGVAGSVTGPVSATAGQTVGDVTSLTATAILNGVRITGTLPTNPDLAGVQVLMGTTSTLGSASVVATGLASKHDQMGLTPADGARYFWVRCFNASGNFGNYVGPVNATALSSMGSTGGRPAQVGNGAAYSLSSSSWSDNKANRIISNMLTGATGTTDLATTTHLVRGDIVTLTNGSSFVEKRYWNGSSWVALTMVEGAVFVDGDIVGTSNLDIGGTAEFHGSTTTGSGTATVSANSNAASGRDGLHSFAVTGSNAVFALATGSGSGVLGQNTGTGSGIAGLGGNTSTGVSAANTGSGNALAVTGKSTFSGQITSTLATGTSPFAVTSTTKVTNLNADQLDGLTTGHSSGNIPISDGTVNTNLNAEKWNGATLGALGTGAATATFTSTNKPGSSSGNTWVAVVFGGVTYYWPVWT